MLPCKNSIWLTRLAVLSVGDEKLMAGIVVKDSEFLKEEYKNVNEDKTCFGSLVFAVGK